MVPVAAAALLLVSAGTPQEPPGSRAAINAVLDRLYLDQKDHRFGLLPAFGEPVAPLAEVVVYRAAAPVPHWHYVTYGLSELGEKTSADPKLSGFGVEYTLRLVDPAEQPPSWPINLLRWLAGRVWKTSQPYDPGHSMNLPSPMLEEVSPGVEGLAFFEDEALRTIDTVNGSVRFVNVIPLAAGEYALISSWDAFKVADELRAQHQDLLWRPGRKSLLGSARAPAIRARAEKDGSSQSVDFVELACGEQGLVLDATSRKVLEKSLRYRLAYGRAATVISPGHTTQLTPGPWRFTFGKQTCQVQVPQAEARALAAELAKAKGGVIKRGGGLRLRLEAD